jgi:hypothetical protein
MVTNRACWCVNCRNSAPVIAWTTTISGTREEPRDVYNNGVHVGMVWVPVPYTQSITKNVCSICHADIVDLKASTEEEFRFRRFAGMSRYVYWGAFWIYSCVIVLIVSIVSRYVRRSLTHEVVVVLFFLVEGFVIASALWVRAMLRMDKRIVWVAYAFVLAMFFGAPSALMTALCFHVSQVTAIWLTLASLLYHGLGMLFCLWGYIQEQQYARRAGIRV